MPWRADMRFTTAICVGVALAAPASLADSHVDLNFKLQACAALEPDDSRLGCYDRIALEHRPAPRLAEFFSSIAMHYEAGANLMEKLEFGPGIEELQRAFLAIEDMKDWKDEMLALAPITGLKVTEALQGGVSAEQNRLAGVRRGAGSLLPH